MTDVRDRVTLSSSRVLLVGERNPISTHDEFALFSRPVGCSGHRLQEKILGLPEADYLALHRVNLCVGEWSAAVAREGAKILLKSKHDAPVVVMLGRKVATAFSSPPVEPFRFVEMCGCVLVSLPHPSGLCRAWHEPGAVTRARALLRWLAPEVAWGSLDHV